MWYYSNFQSNLLANLFYIPGNWRKTKTFLQVLACPFWNKVPNSCTPPRSMVPNSNNTEEDKTWFSFWISRQWYVTTPRNVVNSPANQHSIRKAQSPFVTCIKTKRFLYKDKYTLSWKGKCHTIQNAFSSFFSFFFFFVKSKWIILMQKLHEYIQPERASYIYKYVHV